MIATWASRRALSAPRLTLRKKMSHLRKCRKVMDTVARVSMHEVRRQQLL
jgi:hypothetical protein